MATGKRKSKKSKRKPVHKSRAKKTKLVKKSSTQHDRSKLVLAILVVLLLVSVVQTMQLVGMSQTPTAQVVKTVDEVQPVFTGGPIPSAQQQYGGCGP